MKKSSKTATPSLRPLKLPAHEVRVLPNGLTVHLVPRGPLPLVAVRLVIRGGSAFDPVGKLGVGDFAARLFRRGAGGMTANEISETVEFVGASVGGFANEENVIISLSTPSKHFTPMFEVMSKVLLEPTFPESEVELARRRTLAALTNDLDDPGSLAERAITRTMWGDHPYAHELLQGKKDIEAYTIGDLKKFHRERLGPKVSHLYVVGAFDAKEVMKTIERTLGGWSGGPNEIPTIPEWAGLARPGEVIIVDKPEQTQVQMRIGAAGVKRGHADHFPLVTMNTVLGGGFTSRLVTEIRVKRGLSYGAGSSWDMMSSAGTFSVSSFTRTESINTLIDVALGEVKKMREKGPSKAELATVQRYISGLYPARLETNENVSGAIADVVHYGLSDEWISQYRERIAAVTVKEAARAANTHLFGKERSIVLVGNAEQLKKKVEKYGPVTVWKPSQFE
ncbi:MAG: peptidase M16 [Archangium gephyra]|uniref:Peptidase M16 n=1 Tax=Archangium gephyra TaxID=48 RepID=A0A2W5V3A9_9BACT|nr:MAG: peptidase M16 [Archangium gephyra]